VRISNTGSYGLGDGTSEHKLQKVLGGFSVVRSPAVVSHQLRLQSLINHEVDDCFGNAEIRSGDAFVETT